MRWGALLFALVLAIFGLCAVAALRWPSWAGMPELGVLRDDSGFRVVVHVVLLSAYALALLSLLLRPRKAIGATALVVALAATILGGSAVQPEEAHNWGIFFGIDFFAVNMVAAGLMFGLAFATVLCLIVTPVLYAIFYEVHKGQVAAPVASAPNGR